MNEASVLWPFALTLSQVNGITLRQAFGRIPCGNATLATKAVWLR